MALLLPSEYDVNYFDGYLNPAVQHPAGYTRYERWNGVSNDFVPVQQSVGEYFADLATFYNIDGFLQGKKFMELGCGKGYIVAWLRSLGIRAWGMEVSAYAISQADPAVQPYLINANAVTGLNAYKKNDFNVIYSRHFLACLSDANLALLITQMNRVGFLQIHHIWTTGNPEYYNIKTIQQALALPFKAGTRLIENDNVANPYIK